jgi:hypothetical protein
MKKITLLLAAVVMLSSGAFAEGKCCKGKKEKCSKESACCKDKKNCKKSCHKDEEGKKAEENKEAKKDAPKS